MEVSEATLRRVGGLGVSIAPAETDPVADLISHAAEAGEAWSSQRDEAALEMLDDLHRDADEVSALIVRAAQISRDMSEGDVATSRIEQALAALGLELVRLTRSSAERIVRNDCWSL